MARAYPGTYYFLVRHLARIWGSGFEWFDSKPVYQLIQPLRRTWNLTLGQSFIRWLKRQSFDLVVATHFLPADVCGAGKQRGWFKTRLVVVITDLHPHRFWLAPEADAFVVATEATAAECQQRGIPRERLHVLGIPTARGFSLPVDRPALLRRFGLDATRLTLLVTSGGTTVGPFNRVVEALLRLEDALPGRVQLVVVCGENARAAARLERRVRTSPMPVKVFGFVDNMPELMGSSDLVIAKAGGMTVTEALNEGLPLILYHAIPGQEWFNAQYVSGHGAAIIARGPRAVTAAVRKFVERPEPFVAMRNAARALSHPDAAEAIASQVIQPLLQSIVHSP